MHEFFFENLRNPAHSRRDGLMRQFSSGQLYSSGLCTARKVTWVESPPPHVGQVAMTNNFHIRMKNAVYIVYDRRSSDTPRPTSSWSQPSAPCGPLLVWLK
jgi:hypothetical protein